MGLKAECVTEVAKNNQICKAQCNAQSRYTEPGSICGDTVSKGDISFHFISNQQDNLVCLLHCTIVNYAT